MLRTCLFYRLGRELFVDETESSLTTHRIVLSVKCFVTGGRGGDLLAF